MSTVGIVTDSHSSISQAEAQKLGIYVLPMPFYFGDTCYYEDVTLSREEFFSRMKNGENVSTSQPSPAAVMKIWDNALAAHEQIIYIPISSGLSGSCSTANMLAQEESYENRVFVVDNERVATPMHRSVLDAWEMANEGYSAEQIKSALEEAKHQMAIYIGMQTLENLKRGGRISSTTAVLGSMLNIKPILKFGGGKLELFKKCHGFARTKKELIEILRQDIQTAFYESYKKGELYLLAASSASEEETRQWYAEVRAAFPDSEVLCDDLSLGVSCHIGYGGLGLGCSCRPKRPN